MACCNVSTPRVQLLVRVVAVEQLSFLLNSCCSVSCTLQWDLLHHWPLSRQLAYLLSAHYIFVSDALHSLKYILLSFEASLGTPAQIQSSLNEFLWTRLALIRQDLHTFDPSKEPICLLFLPGEGGTKPGDSSWSWLAETDSPASSAFYQTMAWNFDRIRILYKLTTRKDFLDHPRSKSKCRLQAFPKEMGPEA